MDQIKVGGFIAEMRKRQGLTQKDLAEQLELSDKTISKWECGKSMPDPSVMIPLCKVLDINVNELLSGERLDAAEYSRKAEENMVNLIIKNNQDRNTQRRDRRTVVLGEVILCLLVVWIVVAFGGFHSLGYTFDMYCFVIMLAVNLTTLMMLGLVKDFGRAVKSMFTGMEEYGRNQLKRHLLAVQTVSVASMILGGIVSTISILIMLYHMTDLSVIGPSLAVSLIGLDYGFVVAFLLLPVQIKHKLALLNMPEMKS